jgi:hypothetical protein
MDGIVNIFGPTPHVLGSRDITVLDDAHIMDRSYSVVSRRDLEERRGGGVNTESQRERLEDACGRVPSRTLCRGAESVRLLQQICNIPPYPTQGTAAHLICVRANHRLPIHNHSFCMPIPGSSAASVNTSSSVRKRRFFVFGVSRSPLCRLSRSRGSRRLSTAAVDF